MDKAPRRPTATLDEVARKAGVSRATASRAINGGPNVSKQSREAVARAVRTLRYSPNRAAQSLAGKVSYAVALLIPEPSSFALSDPFIGEVINGASVALSDSELQLLLLISRPTASSAKTTRFLNSGDICGAIVASHHTGGVLEQTLEDSGLLSVFVGRPAAGVNDSITYVDLDNVRAGELAVEHFLARGRRRVATITGPADMAVVADRLEGWRRALAAAGLPAGPVDHGTDFQNGAEDAVTRILEADPDVDAVFAQSDLLAVGAMRGLARLGRRVPEDVAVVGVDNFATAISSTPRLTTIGNPAAELAALAAAMLVDWLAAPGEPAPAPRVLSPQLVVRESA